MAQEVWSHKHEFIVYPEMLLFNDCFLKCLVSFYKSNSLDGSLDLQFSLGILFGLWKDALKVVSL